ncbi:hypothetical protein CBS101457_001419 [Exobasidium rhododendri]|nr:hypothetical protein CBS101457_001419 [Exobasidium rhododendri]
MFWRFGFSSTSSLDTLLDKPNVTLEEILDEDELLQECKTQNSKLVNYLQQPRVLKRLFEHVVGTAEVGGPGGREWEEKVRFKYPYICSEILSCDIWSIIDKALTSSDELLIPFWNAILTSHPTSNQTPLPHHLHPLFSSPPTEPSSPKLNREDKKRVTSASDNGPGKSVLAGYWAKVNGVFLDKKPKEMLEFIRSQPRILERFVANLEIPAVVDLLYRIIQCEESVPKADVVDWLSSQDLIPSVVDLLSPDHSADLHNTVSELLKAIIALSAPSPANLTQNQGQEGFGFGSEGFGGMANNSICGVNNRLVRELASEKMVRKMVSFMLDDDLSSQVEKLASISLNSDVIRVGGDAYKLSSASSASGKTNGIQSTPGDSSAVDDEELDEYNVLDRKPLSPSETPAGEQTGSSLPNLHRDSPSKHIKSEDGTTPPVRAPQVAITPESRTSTLVTCIGVLIELIRKNNSDYFEQHLFHTLRTHLLQRQQEIAEKKAQEKGEKQATQRDKEEDEEAEDEDDDEMEGMEEAMAELSDKLGIVHLGPMLRILCERLPDFQRLITRPRLTDGPPTATNAALTFERYRITELYAELLHCSNMALLNRAKGEGPQYNQDGVLQGGIEGLQILARTLQGGDSASDSGDGAPNESTVGEVSLNETLAAGGAIDENITKEPEAGDGAPSSRSHSRDATRHVRAPSSTGVGLSNGSEDTDDEALLSEVSLNETDGAVTTTIEDADPFADTAGKEVGETEELEDGEKEEDVEMVSVHSTQSIADRASMAPSISPSLLTDTTEYVVGDLLKRLFLESNVIATILSLFFDYPWNNFLHNVVYDILQQFFNGRMDVGLNQRLTLAVFEEGRLTEKIVEGHHRNEQSLQSPRRIRMGYMGHMNLIAEETVKLLERYPNEIERHVKDHISPEWQAYVNETLKENREKEAAPLAGGRPQLVHPLAFPNHQLGRGNGNGGMENDHGGEGGESDAFANYLTSQMGAGNTSDDDDSDEDASWLSQDIKQRGQGGVGGGGGGGGRDTGFDDAFEPSSSPSTSGLRAAGKRTGQVEQEEEEDDDDDDDDDDEWGPFADSSETIASQQQSQQASSSAQAYLTSADWASDFQRSTTAKEATVQRSSTLSELDDEANGSNGEEEEGEREGGERRKSSDSGDSSDSTPFIDLLDSSSFRQTDAVAAAHARRPSLGQHEDLNSDTREDNRRASFGAGSSDPSAAQASDAKEPLGPGVSADARSNRESGMIERTIDGHQVRVPLDDVALMTNHVSQESAIEGDDLDTAAE